MIQEFDWLFFFICLVWWSFRFRNISCTVYNTQWFSEFVFRESSKSPAVFTPTPSQKLTDFLLRNFADLFRTGMLEKQSKFPRYNMKCSGKHDTPWNICSGLAMEVLWHCCCLSLGRGSRVLELSSSNINIHFIQPFLYVKIYQLLQYKDDCKGRHYLWHSISCECYEER